MKRLTLASFIFAALLGVSAQAQIITNYGDATYGAGSNWSGGSWDGASGKSISNSTAPLVGRWAAQTFTAPAAAGATIYAYNFQLNVNAATPTFTASIYEWSSSSGTTVGAPLAGTTTTFTVSSSGFGLYGLNLVTNPGAGVALTPGATYALVLTRTDLSTSGLVQYGYDDTGSSNPGNGEYAGGGAFRSSDGITYSSLGANDMAFWISFDPNSLSPVPEPAVNGAIIGGVFVLGLVGYRRYGRKASAAPADVVAAV